VLVDTDDAKWPTRVSPGNPAPTVADARTTWRDALIGANGIDAFYREMSGGRLGMSQVSGGVLGPVSLGGKWTDWMTMNAKSQWYVKDEVVDRVVGSLQGTPGVDWTAVDAVFLVFRSAGGNFIWPRADNKRFKVKVKNPAGNDVDVVLAKLGMPHDQLTAPGLGFTNVEVTSHELGHTLGLDDIYMDTSYSAEMQARDLGGHELMGNEQNLPHIAARHKLLLGFLDPGHVRSFVVGLEDDVTFELAPLAAGLPPAGRVSAVELKVTPKLSWFFELRQPVPGKLGDGTAFGAGGQVMGYDATSYKNPPVVADKRRPIILLLDDGDGEGSLLVGGQDYEKLDTSHLDAIQMFRLEVLSITAGVAKVRVKTGKVAQPDPLLHDNNGEAGDYKSPDIEIQNELSDVDAAWLNKPLLRLPNKVVATVFNAGGLDAPDVIVRFSVLPFNTDDPDSARWTELGGSVKHDVAAGATVKFETGWVPTVNAHLCIQARIDRYVRVKRAAANEPDVDNNKAVSNYFEIFSKPSSPATREVAFVDVHNPSDRAVDAAVELSQDTSRYRSYVDHRWVHLQPGESRSVRVEVESKATNVLDAVEAQRPDGNTWLRSWLPGAGCRAVTGSGVTLGVRTAVETLVRVVEQSPGQLLLRVESPAGAPAPSTGTVAMQVEYEDGRREVISGAVEANGLVRLTPEPGTGRGTLHYSGARGYAPSSGEQVGLEGR